LVALVIYFYRAGAVSYIIYKGTTKLNRLNYTIRDYLIGQVDPYYDGSEVVAQHDQEYWKKTSGINSNTGWTFVSNLYPFTIAPSPTPTPSITPTPTPTPSVTPTETPTPTPIDHINGDGQDDRRENMIGVCPNCHSVTPTWRGKNKYSSKRISDEIAIDALKTEPTIRQALIKCGLAPKGGNYIRFTRLLETISGK
jgi:hypothetical protein